MRRCRRTRQAARDLSAHGGRSRRAGSEMYFGLQARKATHIEFTTGHGANQRCVVVEIVSDAENVNARFIDRLAIVARLPVRDVVHVVLKCSAIPAQANCF